MKRMIRFLATTLFVVLMAAACRAAAPMSYADIDGMVHGYPTLDQAGGHAVIWRRNLTYSTDQDGRGVKDVQLVVLADSNLSFDWLQSQLAAPQGGQIVLDQATVFTPGNPGGTQNISTRADTDGILWLNWPSWFDGTRVIVLSYRQISAPGQTPNDLVWLGSRYLVWEGSVSVRLSANQELYYNSSDGQEPAVKDAAPYFWYQWFYAHQAPSGGRHGLIASADSYLVLSIHSGTAGALSVMDEVDGIQWLTPLALGLSKTSSPAEVVKTLDSLWADNRRHIAVPGLVRNSEYRHAPLTDREMVSAMAAGLRKVGFGAQIWWHSPMVLLKEVPDTGAVLTQPVLVITSPGSRKPWFYTPQTTPDPGHLPPALAGRTVYMKKGDKLTSRTFSAGNYTSNRLTADWNLDVGLDGNVTGTLSVAVRSGWVKALYPQGIDKDGALSPFKGLEGWYHGTPVKTITGKDGAVRIVLDVRRKTGIPAPQGMSVSVPSLDLMALNQLQTTSGQISLVFPFVLEQNYTMQLHGDYRPMSLPNPADQGGETALYSVTQRFNRVRKEVTGTEKLIIRATDVDSSWSESFHRLLKLWGLWKVSNLMLVK